LGMNWMGGVEEGGYRQCGSPPAFPDGRCYEHSEYESLDMVAFLRTLCSVSGPREPTPRSLCQIGLVRVEELLNTLRGISPATRKDFVTKQKLLEILRVAWAILRSRERRARIDRENWIPPEFWARHRRSSMSPFEFSLKKHFQELEVAVDATREEVLKAWKKLCLKFHPDLAGGDEERMKRINLAKDRIFRIRRWH
ncbi:MAG: J domain-containing protein, partial [Deltaproteobacteria bacterium]|nr:J domain-containing protein [Deltaproteobacteria bacterium]